MKKVSIWVLVVCILLFVIVGIVLGQYFTSKVSFENKKENPFYLKKYILNLNGEEFINLLEDNKYEYAFRGTNNDIEVKRGTFEVEKDIIEFDSKLKAVLKNDKIYKDADDIEFNELNIKNIYFAEDKILNNFNLFNKSIKKEIINKKNDSNNLAKVSAVRPTIEFCLVKENKSNIVCSINYNIYFDENENYEQELCEDESNPKFFPYIVSSGACESTYASNWSYFEFDKEYNIIGAYTGL